MPPSSRGKKLSATQSRKSGDRTERVTSAVTEPSSEMVESGFKTAVTALEDAVGSKVQEYGPEYLDEALDKAQEALELLVAWGKKNPIKSAAAATALIGITAFGLAIMKRRSMSKKK